MDMSLDKSHETFDDLVQRRMIDLRRIEILVLDEAHPRHPPGSGDIYPARVDSFRIRALEREIEESQMKVKEFDPASAERAWQAFRSSVGIAAIQTPRQYEQTVAFMNQLVDLVGENERHPLAGLLDLVGELVAAYESRIHPVPDAPPREVLRLLMEQNGLTQADLHREVGGQPVVSAILNGKRKINSRQAKALAARFRVSPAAFI
jgi:HTH-type transcriptional regulator/antitoxin HigA